MLESFSVAFNAVAPFLILLGIGFAAVRLKLTARTDRLLFSLSGFTIILQNRTE